MLVDSASMYYRAFYGVPDSVQAPDGTPVNAVRGFLDMLSRLVTLYRPTQLVACWDDDWRPAFRVELLPTYKAHRLEPGSDPAASVEETPDLLAPQVPIIVDLLVALGIARVGSPGFEADDVIGTLATNAPGHVDVVTGDRDLFQLVTDDVTILYVARGISKYETVDDAWLATRYGICGAQYLDYSVMRGDASDGLPGVAGIGEKTAAKLLADHGDLEGIAASTTLSPSIAAKLSQAADYIGRARQVVAVRTDLSLPGDLTLPHEVADPAAFQELTELLALGSPAARLVDAMRNR